MEILPNMIDNGKIQCSDDKEIIYAKDYVYVHKDIEKVEIEDNGMTSVVYKCHEYKYPVMEYIELMKAQADSTEQQSAISALRISNLLQSED